VAREELSLTDLVGKQITLVAGAIVPLVRLHSKEEVDMLVLAVEAVV
jgi:hypothetical protein